MRRHAELLTAFFGPTTGIRHMRKWCVWYTSGFRGAAELRASLARVDGLNEMLALLDRLDPEEPFPLEALRRSRAKDARRQDVRLPHGYLDARADDAPPVDDLAGWDAALSGG